MLFLVLKHYHVEGETYEETINEIKQVIVGFIEVYKKNGEEIQTDNYTIASVSVPV